MNQITTATSDLVGQVARKSPLVHNITNYVTVNDVANSLLAIGASPIMADDIAEAADIASISSAVVLNIGTLNQRMVQSMVAAGQKANELGIPVVLDPVGAVAMFATATKTDARLVSMQELKDIRKAVPLPIVVIGGINHDTVPRFAGTGINGLAVVSAILAQPDIPAAARELKKLFQEI